MKPDSNTWTVSDSSYFASSSPLYKPLYMYRLFGIGPSDNIMNVNVKVNVNL